MTVTVLALFKQPTENTEMVLATYTIVYTMIYIMVYTPEPPATIIPCRRTPPRRDAAAAGARLTTYHYTGDRRADEAETARRRRASLCLNFPQCLPKGTGAAGDPHPHGACPLHGPHAHTSTLRCRAYPESA